MQFRFLFLQILLDVVLLFVELLDVLLSDFQLAFDFAFRLFEFLTRALFTLNVIFKLVELLFELLLEFVDVIDFVFFRLNNKHVIYFENRV